MAWTCLSAATDLSCGSLSSLSSIKVETSKSQMKRNKMIKSDVLADFQEIWRAEDLPIWRSHSCSRQNLTEVLCCCLTSKTQRTKWIHEWWNSKTVVIGGFKSCKHSSFIWGKQGPKIYKEQNYFLWIKHYRSSCPLYSKVLPMHLWKKKCWSTEEISHGCSECSSTPLCSINSITSVVNKEELTVFGVSSSLIGFPSKRNRTAPVVMPCQCTKNTDTASMSCM